MYFVQHGVSHEDVIRGRTTQPVKDVTYELASLAHTHLSLVGETVVTVHFIMKVLMR